MSNAAVARTYAHALFEAADTQASRVAEEITAIAAVKTNSAAEWQALIAPGVSASAKKSAIDALAKDAIPLTLNLLKLLVDNGRLDDLQAIAQEFQTIVREHEGQLDVHVTSAVELSNDLKTKLEQRLSSSTGHQVQLHSSVDPEIIGGLIVRHGDTLIDTSLRGRLESMRLQLSRPQHSAVSGSNQAE